MAVNFLVRKPCNARYHLGHASQGPSQGRCRSCGRDMEAGAVSVRLRHGGPQGAKPKAEVVVDNLLAIRKRLG